MNLTLQQLRAFSSVARLGSFVEAARVMHLTPAALSQLVRALETEVGFRVFNRTTRHLELSWQGHAYLPHAERVLDELRTAQRMADEVREHSAGLVRLAITPLMQTTLLPPALAAFRQRQPSVIVELAEVTTERMLESVENGLADLAISYAMPVRPTLDADSVFTSRLHAVLHPTHRLAGRKSLRWGDLRREPLIFVARNMELRVRAELPSEIELDARYRTSNGISAFALVAGGAGIAIAPGYARGLATVHGLHVVELTRPVIDRRFMLYRRHGSAPTPAVDACQRFFLEYFGRAGRQRI